MKSGKFLIKEIAGDLSVSIYAHNFFLITLVFLALPPFFDLFF